MLKSQTRKSRRELNKMSKKRIVLILVIFCSIMILVNRKPQTKFIAANEEDSFIAA